MDVQLAEEGMAKQKKSEPQARQEMTGLEQPWAAGFVDDQSPDRAGSALGDDPSPGHGR